MTALDMDQLRAVVELAKAHKQLQHVEHAQAEAEAKCKDLAVSDAQIAAILGVGRAAIGKRRQRRYLQLVESEALPGAVLDARQSGASGVNPDAPTQRSSWS